MNRLLRVWIIVCAVIGAALFISQLAEIPYRSALRGYDNTFNYLWLRSAMVDGDWDFRNDIERADTLTPEYRAAALTLPEPPTGRIPNKYGIGWAVVTLPFYVVADRVVAGGRALGLWALERDGFNPVYQLCIQVGHAALALIALLLAIRTVTLWIGDRAAAIGGVLTVWLASPLLYYQTANLSMSHGTSFFAVAVLAYAVTRARGVRPGERVGAGQPVTASAPAGALRRRLALTPATGWWLLAGAGWGLAVVTRFQLAVFGVVVVWAAMGGDADNPSAPAEGHIGPNCRRAFGRRLGLIALGAAPFILVQLWAWHVVYGEWLVFSYGAEGESFHWTNPALLNALFSSWHGLFYWHPFLLIALAGVLRWAWFDRQSALPWLLAVFLTLYVNAAWWCWWFASAFGSRSFDAALLPLMAGGAWWLARAAPAWRKLYWTAASVAGLWNVYLVLLYRSGAISRSAAVSWSQMLDAARALPDAVRF